MLKDMNDTMQPSVALNTTTLTDNTVTTGNVVDTVKFQGCEFYIASGDLADASATFTWTIQEGEESDLSDAADVTANQIRGTAVFTQANDNAVKHIGYQGTKRYIRCKVTPTGNADDATFTVIAVQGGGVKQPHS